LRGGGGNFGVVTSFLYRLHPVSIVLSGLLLYPRDQAGAVLRNFRAFMTTAPEELTAYGGLIWTLDGAPVVGVGLCYCGDIAEGERVLKPLRAFGSPIVDAIQPMPFPAMQKLLEGAYPDKAYNYWKSMFLKTLSGARRHHRPWQPGTVSAVRHRHRVLRRCGNACRPGRYGVCPAAGRVQHRHLGAVDRCRRE
jgi:hypothetical protein